MTRAPVVVGVDSVATSRAAILTAAWEADRRRSPLVLAHGDEDAMNEWPWVYAPHYSIDHDPLGDAKETLAAALAVVRGHFPDLTVETRLWTGSAAGGLVEEGHTARLLVVGARGSGGLAGLSIGSVAVQTATHATCPVIVVRPAGPEAEETAVPRPGPVVVGVDGSANTDAALTFAFEEASLRGVPLVALNSWWMLPRRNLGPVYPGTYDDLDDATEEARRLLSEAIAGWSSRYPDVAMEARVVHEMSPTLALTQASRDAGLVVVGSRGRGGFAGLLLGSVGRDLVATAHGPIAVVHPS